MKMPGKGSHNILNIRGIIDDAKCFHTVRELRWSDGVRCAHCGSNKDGDGFCEVHINTMEGFWSLLRSRLRPHRGISQELLPNYLGFFEFAHNEKRRGEKLLQFLLQLFLDDQPGIQ